MHEFKNKNKKRTNAVVFVSCPPQFASTDCQFEQFGTTDTMDEQYKNKTGENN